MCLRHYVWNLWQPFSSSNHTNLPRKINQSVVCWMFLWMKLVRSFHVYTCQLPVRSELLVVGVTEGSWWGMLTSGLLCMGERAEEAAEVRYVCHVCALCIFLCWCTWVWVTWEKNATALPPASATNETPFSMNFNPFSNVFEATCETSTCWLDKSEK